MTQKGCSLQEVLHAKCQMLFPKFPPIIPFSLMFATEENTLNVRSSFSLFWTLRVGMMQISNNGNSIMILLTASNIHLLRVLCRMLLYVNVFRIYSIYIYICFFCGPCVCEASYVHFVTWRVFLFLYGWFSCPFILCLCWYLFSFLRYVPNVLYFKRMWSVF